MQHDNSSPDTERGAAATPAPHRGPGRSRGTLVTMATLGLFGVIFAVGLVPRLRLQPQLAHAAAAKRIDLPIVTVVHPRQPPSASRLDLPGTIEPLTETTISARANGYLKAWMVDIGDHVKAGQLLAVIQAPETDALTAQAQAQVAGSNASLQQSRASVAAAQANTVNAEANYTRALAALDQAQAQLQQTKSGYSQALAQTNQQQAALLQQQAARDLAKVEADRYASLEQQGAIAREVSDQHETTYKTAEATVRAAQASVDAAAANARAVQDNTKAAQANVTASRRAVDAAKAQVSAAQANVAAGQAGVGAAAATVSSNLANYQHNAILQGFQRVTAPFDGIITARNVDVGSLVSTSGGPTGAVLGPAGSGATGGLFGIQRTDHVRIFVSIPQTFIGSLVPGQQAQVTISALGRQPFSGVVVRNAASLDPASRTLLTEIQLANPHGLLRPGMFATVAFDVRQKSDAWRIPDSALIADAEGTRVATVSPNGKLHFQPVVVGTDYGKEMDITEGLTGHETLVSNPNASFQEGMAVQTVAPPVLKKPGK